MSYIIYPEGLGKDIPELTTLREEWSHIYIAHQLITSIYAGKAKVINDEIRKAELELEKSIRYFYSLTTREYNRDRYGKYSPAEKVQWYIIKRTVDMESVPEQLKSNKEKTRVFEDAYSYPFELISDVIVPHEVGGLYLIVTAKEISDLDVTLIKELIIPEDVFNLPNQSNRSPVVK